jgi:hypothetical protein
MADEVHGMFGMNSYRTIEQGPAAFRAFHCFHTPLRS